MHTTYPRATGTITAITRLRNSANGNPRFDVTLDGERTVRTMPDSSWAYDVQNLREGQQVAVRWRMYRGRPSVVAIHLI
jgi:hypothetical protein